MLSFLQSPDGKHRPEVGALQHHPSGGPAAPAPNDEGDDGTLKAAGTLVAPEARPRLSRCPRGPDRLRPPAAPEECPLVPPEAMAERLRVIGGNLRESATCRIPEAIPCPHPL